MTLRHSHTKGSILLTLLFVILVFASASPLTIAGESHDMAAAIEYCEDSVLDPIEGIWEFPDDQTTVLIRKTLGEPYKFSVYALRSPDCRLNAGDLIGTLCQSPESTKLRLSLYTKHIGGILSDSRECLAEFSHREGSIRIYPKKIKLSIRTNRLLPGYWKAVSVSKENPLDRLPIGLIRIFPNHGQINTNTRKPCYY